MNRRQWIHAAAIDLAAFVVVMTLSLQSLGETVCENGVCRVALWDEPSICQIDGATGNFIEIDGRRNYILTCAHAPPTTAGGPSRSVNVGDVLNGYNRTKLPLAARVVAVDADADVAILEFTGVAKSVAPIAAAEPPPNESVTLAGFANGGPLHRRWLRVVNYSDPHCTEAFGYARPGDSGGPVRNRSGQLVGILSGGIAENGAVFYGRLGPIQRLIQSLRGQFAAAPPQTAPWQTPLVPVQPIPAPAQPAVSEVEPPAIPPVAAIPATSAPAWNQPAPPAEASEPPPTNPPAASITPDLGGAISSGLAWLATRALTAAGLSAPGVLVGAYLAKRFAFPIIERGIKKRFARLAAAVPTSATPPAYTLEEREDVEPETPSTPPPPPKRPEKHVNHYVTVEGDLYQRATVWASAALVKKYPGAEETMLAHQSLIDQYIAANQ